MLELEEETQIHLLLKFNFKLLLSKFLEIKKTQKLE